MITKTTQFLCYRSCHISPLCAICKRSFTALSITQLVSDLEIAGSSKNNDKVIELWHHALSNDFNKNTNCSRTFLYWFSSLGQIQYTLDVISSLIPNVTTDDTLQLLTSYKNAQNHTMAQSAMQVLIDNECTLSRDHFDVLITTSANNGDMPSITNILNVMESSNIEPNQETLDVIFKCLENHFKNNKYSRSDVNIHSIITDIQQNIFKLCYISNRNEYTVTFMEWYCAFGDVTHAFNLYERVSFEKHALKSHIMEELAIQQISLVFKNAINLSKAISLLNEVLQIKDDSLYSLFSLDSNNNQIIPKPHTSRHIFDMLNGMKSTNWCHVNVLNLLLHISYLSRDLHSALYILHELYLHHNNQIKHMNIYTSTHSSAMMKMIEPNHDTIGYISKLFQNYSVSVQPSTIDWSMKIYQWLLHKYKDNEFILDVLANTTQHLLKLLLLHDVDNMQSFCDVLRWSKMVIPSFEADPQLFAILGKQIVNDQTQIKAVLDNTIDIYGYLIETRDGASNSKKITSVADRARLLGSILTNYDRNICKAYQDSIGASKQSYFKVRRDLQQQLVLKLHRKYSLADILTLDVLKLTDTKPVQHTTALTNIIDDTKRV